VHVIWIMSHDHRHLFAPPAATIRSLRAGETLFFAGEPVSRVALVSDGRVNLVRRKASGMTVILQTAGPGEVLAEASVYSQTYHCGAEAVKAAVVHMLPVATFRGALRKDAALAEAWAAHLARAVQTARARAEICTLRTVAERLDAWLGDSRNLPEKGHLQDLATEIGVTREALYRELARRR
jgi:CRP-like cAMP-binding protein